VAWRATETPRLAPPWLSAGLTISGHRSIAVAASIASATVRALRHRG
jgi:hypothetical protein